MKLSFAPITLNDVEQLMPIEDACHSHPWNEKTFKSCIDGRYFGHYAYMGINESKPISIDVAIKTEIIGFYIADVVAGEVTLMDICVVPEQQGKGLGKTILLEFIQQAKSLHASKIWLEVRAKNITAQMLYINQGFKETGRRTGYYPSAKGFGYEDAIVMCKTL